MKGTRWTMRQERFAMILGGGWRSPRAVRESVFKNAPISNVENWRKLLGLDRLNPCIKKRWF